MSIRPDKEQTDSFALGSSIYGGRPTFALVRDEADNDVSLTLYELLPTEQANARHRRLKRRRQEVSQTLPVCEVVNDDIDGFEDWTWDGWVAVKIRRLSGARVRSILPLIENTLSKGNTDSSTITQTGEETMLLHEEAGVRLVLGFIGVKPLQRVDRMRALSRGVMQMSLEECYYWHAKCRTPNNQNGSKALRTLFTSHL